MANPQQSWHEEMQSAYLYRELSQIESDPRIKNLFAKLALTAEAQGQIWKTLAKPQNTDQWTYSPNLRTSIVLKLAKIFGPKKIRLILSAMKVRGLSVYNKAQLQASGHEMPTSIEEVGARHKSASSAGNLRAAVFGINDGLVSNASLILGIAGASADHHTILLAGIAGGLAGAFSMAAGEYISVRSQREMVEYQIGLEEDELNSYPEEEAAELALIYEARGIPLEQAQSLAKKMVADPKLGLATLAREELGIDPEDLNSPWAAGLFSFLAFALGSFVPLLPFLILKTGIALSLCLLATALALFAVGCSLSLFTGRNALLSGIRMVLIGGGAGALSYFIGNLLGS